MILLISDRPQEWTVGSLLKNLLYATLPDWLVDNHAIAEFYYVLLLNNYVAHRIEFERTNRAGFDPRVGCLQTSCSEVG